MNVMVMEAEESEVSGTSELNAERVAFDRIEVG